MEAKHQLGPLARWICTALVLLPGIATGAAPSAEEILWQQAVRRYRAQEWEAAALSFERLAARPQSARRGRALFYAGESCVQAGRYREAAWLLARHLEIEPEGDCSRQARFRLAEASFFQDDWPATAQACAEFRKRYGPSEQDAYLLAYAGRAELAAGDAERARLLLAESIERFPQGPMAAEARLQLGKALAALGKWEAAAQELQQVAAVPDDSLAAEAMVELARVHWKQGQIDAALAQAKELERRSPKSQWLAELQLLHDAAAWLKNPGREGGSWHKLVTRIEKQPGGDRLLSASLLMAAARRLAKTEQIDAALAVFETIIDHYGTSDEAAEAMLAAAAIYEERQQRRAALALYERLARDLPHSPRLEEALHRWAAGLAADGKPAEAERLWQRLHDEFPASPHWADATLQLATAARKRNARAIAGKLLAELTSRRDLSKSASTDEILAAAILLQAHLAADEGRWSDIAPCVRRLAERFPDAAEHDQARFLEAEAALRLGDSRRAAELLEALATQTRPLPPATAALVELRRAQLAAREKRWRDALDRAAKVTSEPLSPRQRGELAVLRGRAQVELGMYAEARQTLLAVRDSAALAGSEEAAVAAWLVGESFLRAGQDGEAIQAYLRAEILHDFPVWRAASLLQAARCYERLGQNQNALKLYARLVEQYPQTPYVAEAARRLQGPPDRTARAVSP